MVQMRLNAGADADALGGRIYCHALETAATRGHEKIVQALLNTKTNMNAEGGRYNNALQAVVKSGHKSTAQKKSNRQKAAVYPVAQRMTNGTSTGPAHRHSHRSHCYP